ncbi:hypothetical protein Pelo_4445 [Pelomyxa schiedti]|nr:hypothetical protein Pelo_4445 [Pelomyxa schiedti]
MKPGEDTRTKSRCSESGSFRWPSVLFTLGISDVLSVMEVRDAVAHRSKFPPGINVSVLQVSDDPHTHIEKFFMVAIDFISKALLSHSRGQVLVHCESGISKSATIVIAFVMYALSMDSFAALQAVQKEYPEANPSPLFRAQLAEFSTELQRTRASQQQLRHSLWGRKRRSSSPTTLRALSQNTPSSPEQHPVSIVNTP